MATKKRSKRTLSPTVRKAIKSKNGKIKKTLTVQQRKALNRKRGHQFKASGNKLQANGLNTIKRGVTLKTKGELLLAKGRK